MKYTRILLILIFLIVGYNAGLAKEKIRKPKYYKSNFSTAYFNSRSSISEQERITESKDGFSVDTLKILAIRVQFKKDSDRGTTGDGWFDLSEPDSVIINSPPHNHQYFTNQLIALKNYFESVSRGKLILDIYDENGKGAVYPQEQDDALTLPNEMGYYNPDSTEELLDIRLGELFHDAFVLADNNSTIDFSKYDVFIVFHAGVGWEFTQELDLTPKDIPSVFLNNNDLKKAFISNNPGYEGVPVNDGTFTIKEGIILPETESQGGYEFGLLGTMSIMMGHQLGLPNLFDTDTGHPGVGNFGLMDQGSGGFFGLLPAQPCAWSKIFLGWETPIEITSGVQIPVAASLAENPNKIYKIPINAKEYFLIENRQRNVLKSRLVAVGKDEFGNQVEFTDDGEINLPLGLEKLGVIVTVDEYDFGLPGSGILIWHIDEQVIEERFAENRVNSDMDHRGVDLVEADGAQDMGHFYNFFGYTGFEPGGYDDIWWDENEAHFYANSSEVVEFTPTSMPNSNAFSGAKTGISITNFSKSDSVMYFSLDISNNQPGFPVYMGSIRANCPMVSGDLDGDGISELVTVNDNAQVIALRGNGEKYITNDDSTAIVALNGDTVKVPLAVFDDAENGQSLFSPVIGDINGDDKPEIIVCSKNGIYYAWEPKDKDNRGRAELGWIRDYKTEFTCPPIMCRGPKVLVGSIDGAIYDVLRERGSINWKFDISQNPIVKLSSSYFQRTEYLYAVDSENVLFLFDNKGSIISHKSFSEYGELNYPATADVNLDGTIDIVLTTANGNLLILNPSLELIQDFSVVKQNCPFSSPALADINNDGYIEIVTVGGGKVWAFQYNGALVSEFPILIEYEHEQDSYSAPVLADFDNNGEVEIVVGSLENKIFAFDIKGKILDGFPLSISDDVAISPGIDNLSADGSFNLFAKTIDGYCNVWKLDYQYSDELVPWGQFLKDAQHNSQANEPSVTQTKTGDLLPEKMVYNYPNPTEGNETTIRYYLKENAEVSIRIYDMAGELIEEFAGPGMPGIENEVTWDISKVQSGVYLARVKAKSEKEESFSIIKIAVVK